MPRPLDGLAHSLHPLTQAEQLFAVAPLSIPRSLSQVLLFAVFLLQYFPSWAEAGIKTSFPL